MHCINNIDNINMCFELEEWFIVYWKITDGFFSKIENKNTSRKTESLSNGSKSFGPAEKTVVHCCCSWDDVEFFFKNNIIIISDHRYCI